MTASGWAQEGSSTEERYSAVQAAFLREDFDRVVRLMKSFAAEPSARPVTASEGRMGLWYALSLDRLQRARDALDELDQLKMGWLHPERGEAESKDSSTDHDRLMAETLFWEGEIARRAHEFVRSRRAYQRMLSQFPHTIWRSQAQLGLAAVLFHQQAYDEALLHAREISGGSLDSPLVRDAIILEGLCHLKRERFVEAQRCFRDVLHRPHPPDVQGQVSIYLAEALVGAGRGEEAVAIYQQLILEHPDASWARLARFGIGWVAFQQGNYRESLERFKEYVHSLPSAARQRADLPWMGKSAAEALAVMGHGSVEETIPQLWFAQGRCLMALGDDEAALTHFDTLQRLMPAHPRAIEAALSAAEILERRQRLDHAVAVMESLAHRSPTAVQRLHIQLRWASLDLARGNAASAEKRFHSVVDSEVLELRQAASNGLGDVYAFLGQDAQAEAWYRKAEALASGNAAGYYATYQRGRLLLKAGHRAEAIEQFRRLTGRASRPDLHDVILNARFALALAYLMNEQLDLSHEVLRQAIQQARDPRQAARVNYYLALLALREGNPTDAKRLCRELVQQAPESDEAFDAHLLLIDFLAGEESLRAALEGLQRYVAAFDQWPVRRRAIIAQTFGRFARQAGAYATAIRWYETAWKLLPSQQGELDYRIASCYEEGGDWIMASHRYGAIHQSPWTIRGQMAAAKLLERASQWQEATRLYQSIMQQAVPEAKIAQERLAALRSLEAEYQQQ
ncbi:MAG: tetratricopeptide repeat protein [Candidatus Omnitrophica bacterium]|nr:tetratricopeptide repeat protein [Candidatus Omnitrophota bacterium]